ncbi:1-phosphatidylinositol-3-phosphate 5-kinase FAB1A isoform X2 [Phoenix dactylifera]|uniref:1-phosphatidylinositol-3-phosphate 5-kinase n=1 Tax=Phoenix dactylifera TaxID=42345 RepID=A0A8B7BQL8_PHODC|nr:1-phosphatidylinositol-3-phosphate 5-kinase FAB1A isoform X2 [Phoenix dactylifera]
MNTMCHACGSEKTPLDSGYRCKICHHSICQECKKRDSSSALDDEYLVGHCKPTESLEKYGKGSLRMDGLSPCTSPLVSPALSLSSYGSCVSSLGDFPADLSSQMRENGVESLDTGQKHPDLRFTEHVKDHRNGNSFKDIDIQSSHAKVNVDGPSVGYLDGSGEKSGLYNGMPGDARSMRIADDSDGTENAIDSSSPTFLSYFEKDSLIWIPPEPEDMEDDMDSIANYDDDDDYGDGTKWGQPSSLSSLDEENGSAHSYKEERQKAMLEAMNGQLKILVSRLLASEGLNFSGKEGDKSWLDIVASLSWEAALLVKPDASEGRAMDPGSYVKVKCIASGTRSESQVIKGLVFKKNAAHKRMPTKFKNPRLLLLQGALGHSALNLLSFESMEEEKDHLKSIIEMIETCQPNVVLVEKTVSRDIRESLLAKGITLVFDMKLSRLLRIARCTASPIISSADILMKVKLKQCESFHIEKFTEEHNICGEGGKRPSKTLMFFEGFPKPLGCTILLKGAHSDELKKVKRVVHYTVFAAYHLIVETSFFADQRLFFSGKNSVRGNSGSSKAKPMLLASCDAAPYSDISSIECSTSSITPVHALDIPIFDGQLEKYVHKQMPSVSGQGAERSFLSPHLNPDVSSLGDSINHRDLFCNKPCSSGFLQSDSSALLKPGQVLSSVSVSVKKCLGESFQSHTSESDSSFFGFNEKMLDVPISSSLEMLDHDKEATATINQEKPDDRNINNAKPGLVSDISEYIERCSCDVSDKVEMQNKDDIQSVLDPQSILVLLSSQCITKQAVCEQSHLSRIKYYGNFDISLGRFLQDVLLNKKRTCSSCGEPPESHVYRYTHQNGTLTVLVRQLPPASRLSGEGEGRIWMWTRCLRCERQGGIPKSTRRVVMSTAARGLSFGKFLELSFSSHSAASRLSKCGHSLHRDCLRFFGLGSKVAMFRYSSVEIYTACKPPPVLEFRNPHGQEWLKRELQNASLLNAINHGEQLGMTVHEVLVLNWLNQEFLLMLYVWDRRLHHLLQHKQVQLKKDGSTCNTYVERNMPENGEKVLEASSQILIDVNESSSSSGNCHAQDMQTELQIESVDDSGDTSSRAQNSLDAVFSETGSSAEKISDRSTVEEHSASFLDHDYGSKPADVSTPTGSSKNGQEAQIPISDDMLVDHSIQVTREPYLEKVSNLELKSDETATSGEMSAMSMSKDHPRMSQEFSNSKLEDPDKWIWAPFSELRRVYKRDLLGGSLQKFVFVNTYTPVHLSPMCQPSAPEMGSLQFTVGPGGNVLSVSEDEISSIIACALAISEVQHRLSDSVAEKEAGESKGETDKTIVKSNSLLFNGSMVSSVLPSTGSLDYEGIHSSQSGSSLSSEELPSPSSDGSSVDRLLASEDLHPEIPVGSGRVAGKSKYSVVCIYAKQFYTLRKKCCPSELAYISSISRCKKWDAQGGKSKAFFAKSMDDRFIIKQIKKTELDSFLKFGPDYFKHISHSIESGSQTCLAKIFGIYQVRQSKSGKEVKTDLMVMENLLFGHSVSRIFDLKGAVFSRYVPPDTNDHQKVLLDQNFIEYMRVSPIYIGGKTKHLLQRAIWNDTAFLTSINVMDYSLLVGVDKQRHELVFGIIDYLRQYTWDKQLETWVKSSLVVPKNSLPTVISPKEYKKRFRKFMTKYFMTVPDTWSSERCSDPCKFCIADSSNSSNVHSEKLSEQPIEACA